MTYYRVTITTGDSFLLFASDVDEACGALLLSTGIPPEYIRKIETDRDAQAAYIRHAARKRRFGRIIKRYNL